MPRKTVLTALVAALVIGAAGGGLAYTKVTVDRADRTAPTTVWDAPEKSPSDDDPVPDLSKGRQDTPLSRELLPVPGGYELGPDIDGFGRDAHLTGKEAEALLRQSAADLPREARKEHRAFVKDLDVRGMAMRSYTPWPDHNLVVEMRLAQMRNKKAVKGLSSLQAGLAEAFSVFREGPEIDGHKEAKCFLMPKGDEEDRVEQMFCTAHEDDVLVSLTATGTAPLAEHDAATLLTNQLDRLTEGGGISA